MKLAAFVVSLLALSGVEGLPQEDSKVRDLIERLSDDEIRIREKAAADLVDLGKASVPALERLSQSGDIELRSRAAAVLRRIAEGDVVGRHWRRGPRITIVSDGATAASVLDELARQSKDTFKYEAADHQEPVTLKVKDATFWDALEALCRAGPPLNWEGDGAALKFVRKPRPPHPAKRQGEFAVWLDSITFNRDFDFTGNARSTFTILFSTAWEAGVAPVGIDQRITEVLDEDGTNLLQPERFGSSGGRMDVPKGRVRREAAYAPLPVGAASVKRFSRVRGHAVFYFPRSYQELSFDLQASPVPLQMDRLTVALRNFRMLKDACAFEVILTTNTTAGEPMVDRLPFADITVIDERGGEHRAPNSSRSQSFSGTSYTIHENLQVPLPEGRAAKSIRLRVLKDVMEKRVPFEFNDIPVE